MATAPIVYLVDDDPDILIELERIVRSADLGTACFASAEALLAARPPEELVGCIVCDLRLPGASGVDLTRELAARGATIPVVIVTGAADTRSTVRAVQAGAVDVLEKPFAPEELLGVIGRALERAAERREEARRKAQARSRIALLTPREREVMAMIVRGGTTKGIAAALGASPSTIEVHKTRIMRKMSAETVVELVRVAMLAGEAELAREPVSS